MPESLEEDRRAGTEPSVSVRIVFILAIASDDPMEASFFQGFSPGLFNLIWAMRGLVSLPGDILELALPFEGVLSRRVSGSGGWSWAPLSIRSLTQVSIAPDEPFWVVFADEDDVAESVASWADRQQIRPLLVSHGVRPSFVQAAKLTPRFLRDHLATVLQAVRKAAPDLDATLVSECLEAWQDRPLAPMPIQVRGHNATLPNYMTLEGAGFAPADGEPFVGQSREEYASAISDSADAVMAVRNGLGYADAYRSNPPVPDLIIASPSLYQHVYESRRRRDRMSDEDYCAIDSVVTMLQRQNDFLSSIESDRLKAVIESPVAMTVLRYRRSELDLQTVATGLRAASTLAATIRLPPSANRAAGALKQLASHARGSGISKTHKLIRLFKALQAHYRSVVGEELLSRIGASVTGVKLVTDAPLEWLPVGRLPLGLRFDVSRITSTPGNLLIGELVTPHPIRLSIAAFNDVLIISAFTDDDPLQNMLVGSIRAIERAWKTKMTLRFVRVSTIQEFIDALNAYHGAILIFDGHGGNDDGIGTISIGSVQLDVWTIRGKARVPPIVVLSACDTLAVDGSHASVANGFLVSGARTVLGTLLPVSGTASATFVARLVLRLAEYLPVAVSAYGRAIQWVEVVSGMLRMQLLTDILDRFASAGHLSTLDRNRIHTLGNTEINALNPDWLDEVETQIASSAKLAKADVMSRVDDAIPLSDTIRYIQVGNPESILVDDERRIKGPRPKLVIERGGHIHRKRE